MTTNGSSHQKLKVAIVGGGICGLACGSALRPFADVTIFEAASALGEIGAAVHLAPNATRLIAEWGGDLEQYGAVPVLTFNEFSSDGKKVIDSSFDPVKDFNHPWLLNHRVDVQNELKRVATKADGPGQPCDLRLGSPVTAIGTESGEITLKNGQTFTADVVIGADGIKSIARHEVLGDNFTAKPSGHSAYRFLLPAETVQSDPELAALGLFDNKITIVNGHERRIICYPCRNKTLLNFVVALPDSELKEFSEERWNASGSTENLVESFSVYAPVWQKLLGKASNPGLWQLRDQDPLSGWVKGRLIIVGDAAHPMLPHQGQGASSALEDAEALAVYLKNVTPEQIPQALKDVFNVRYKRVSTVQEMSRSSGLGEMRAKLAHNLTDLENVNPMQFRDFLWSYQGAKNWEVKRPDMILA